ncbi:uncharacterized protein LOC132948372 [Metopolophium dirhodum]|uniref:uncharacterized protein LOC132948372 n=1 Tax=Metopolophium dirhodum TaxID=44670 RepID=UPI00298F8936|nr:uncharacterized protein LOC132948372 [Metopolophium dirhodum]
MVGSIGNMAVVYKKKKFTYVPPTPPAELIDCNNFILDFPDRKFLNVGLDSEDNFNIAIHIITPSRYVSIYDGFLRRTLSMMGNILSFILDVPQKCRKQIFLEDEFTVISNMVYQGENVLVIESKKKEGCRVLLDRKNLLKLQYLEESIFETVTRKTNIIRPIVLNQFAMIGNYIDREFTKVEKPPKTNEEMVIFIKNLRNDLITTNLDLNYVSQLKMFATSQLAEQWAQRWSGEMSPELFVEPEVQVKPTRYSSMSPYHQM